MNDEKYINNLERFVHSLPPSSIRFLYFNKDSNGSWYPRVNKIAKIWKNHGTPYKNPFYITPGRTSNFIYIYRESSIKYDVYLNDQGNVQAYEKPNLHYHQAGGEKLQANWGDHYTVGLERDVEDNLFYFRNHRTRYVYDPKKTQYYPKRLFCDTLFHPTNIHEKSICYMDGNPTTMTLDMYNQGGVDPYAIPMFQAIVKQIVTPSRRGGGMYMYHQGRKYKIRQGPKGGRYILVHQNKKYITTSFHGGYSMFTQDGFAELFASFLRECLVSKISQQIEYLEEVVYVDDDGSDRVLLRYVQDFGSNGEDLLRSSLYFMSKLYVLNTFHIYLTPTQSRTAEQKHQLDTFASHVQSMPTPHIIEVVQ